MRSIKRSWIFWIGLLVVTLSSCRTAPSTLPTSTSVPVVHATLINTSTLSFIPTLVPTLPGPQVEFEKPTIWTFYDPKDPSLPELIVHGEDGSRLVAGWKAARIEYVYQWWGMGDPQFGYETIQQTGSNYVWKEKEISEQQINEFLATINHLHATPTFLTGAFHTDDYPSWQLDLTGTDGKHIFLYAASNENPGFGPWHVFYNGRLYAQYDGTIGPAVGKLFENVGDNSFAWRGDTSYHPSNMVGFSTSGQPKQLSYGFAGLLPIADSFSYRTDLTEKEVQGYFSGRFSIGGMGHMIVGKIDDLLSIELVENKQPVACDIQKLKSDDPSAAQLTFSCKLVDVKAGQRYDYPVNVVFHTDADEEFTTSGELQGIWQEAHATIMLPPAEEIENAISHNPKLKDLLTDHLFYYAQYAGKINLGQDKSPALLGEITLIGQARVAENEFPYTITMPFAILDGEFLEWDFTRSKLQLFISDVFNSPLTLRIYKAFPTMTLNLWYASKTKPENFPEMPYFLDSYNRSEFAVKVPACGELPAMTLPAYPQPLRAFGFGTSTNLSFATSFVLTNQGAIPYQMNLYPVRDADDKLLPYFVPKGLTLDGKIPFERIGYDHYFKEHTVDINPASEMQAAANSVTTSLPFAVDKKYDPLWSIHDAGIKIDDDGTLSLVPCSK